MEVKRGSQVGESILQTVCAFANEPGLGGGTIILGVEQTNEGMLFPDYIVRGVPDPDQLQSDLVSQCRSVFNTPISITITAEQDAQKTVLIIDVPEAPASSKPVHFLRKPLPGSAFRRLGSADVKCTEDDIAILFQQRSATPFDASVIAGTSMADVDPDAVALYRVTRAEANPLAAELQLNDQELLSSLRCIENRPEGLALTLAGLLLFGRAVAQRRLLPMIRLDYVRVPGREWVPENGERFTETLDMRGPILMLLGRAQAAIMDDLPRAFHLPEGKMQRE
ncbi:MAG: helix-turn-helix domain-containing protein, partial [Rhodoferax sp.]